MVPAAREMVTRLSSSGFPVNGGTTTYSDTVAVLSLPIRASLVVQGAATMLTWSGGAGPYQVQRATDLGLNDWQTVRGDAVSPVVLGVQDRTGSFRVVEE